MAGGRGRVNKRGKKERWREPRRERLERHERERKESDRDERDKKLREGSRRAESVLDLIKAGRQDRDSLELELGKV